jgi:hypothetical protein
MALPLVCFIMGLTRFRQREIVETATREAMDVIQAKNVNANANTFEYFTVEGFTADAAIAA